MLPARSNRQQFAEHHNQCNHMLDIRLRYGTRAVRRIEAAKRSTLSHSSAQQTSRTAPGSKPLAELSRTARALRNHDQDGNVALGPSSLVWSLHSRRCVTALRHHLSPRFIAILSHFTPCMGRSFAFSLRAHQMMCPSHRECCQQSSVTRHTTVGPAGGWVFMHPRQKKVTRISPGASDKTTNFAQKIECTTPTRKECRRWWELATAH